jgi:hypothetical protein
MHVIYSILILGGLLTSSAVHAQSAPALKKGTPYGSVREILIKQGFNPLRFPKEEQQRRCWGRTEICETYPETSGCAGAGRGQCQFVFRGAQGTFVVITTVGEEMADLRYDRSSRARGGEADEYRRYVR